MLQRSFVVMQLHVSAPGASKEELEHMLQRSFLVMQLHVSARGPPRRSLSMLQRSFVVMQLDASAPGARGAGGEGTALHTCVLPIMSRSAYQVKKPQPMDLPAPAFWLSLCPWRCPPAHPPLPSTIAALKATRLPSQPSSTPAPKATHLPT